MGQYPHEIEGEATVEASDTFVFVSIKKYSSQLTAPLLMSPTVLLPRSDDFMRISQSTWCDYYEILAQYGSLTFGEDGTNKYIPAAESVSMRVFKMLPQENLRFFIQGEVQECVTYSHHRCCQTWVEGSHAFLLYSTKTFMNLLLYVFSSLLKGCSCTTLCSGPGLSI